MVPRQNADTLSTVPKCKKAVVCPKEKTEKFHAGRSYSVAGHEFDTHESAMYIKECAFKQKRI